MPLNKETKPNLLIFYEIWYVGQIKSVESKYLIILSLQLVEIFLFFFFPRLNT